MTDYPGFEFEVTRNVTGQTGWPDAARRGRITTPHGVIETPAFVFCAQVSYSSPHFGQTNLPRFG